MARVVAVEAALVAPDGPRDPRHPAALRNEVCERSGELGECSSYDKALAEMFGRKLPSI